MVIRYKYNNRRQLTKTTVVWASGNLVTQNVYDDCGNLWKTIDGNGNTNEYSYSPTQKLLTKKLPVLPDGQPIIQYVYDTRDWLWKTIDPLSRTNVLDYDAGGRKTGVTNPLGHRTQSDYDADDHLRMVTSPLPLSQQQTTYEYNARGERTNLVDALTQAIQYAYDENGNLLRTTNRNSGADGATPESRGRRASAGADTAGVPAWCGNLASIGMALAANGWMVPKDGPGPRMVMPAPRSPRRKYGAILRRWSGTKWPF